MFEAKDRKQWRSWLRKHHRSADEVWLVFYKKHTGKPGVSYPESVEEAICFGWIDGLKKRIDDERYAHRFTPRRRASRWSPANIEIARRMIAGNRMTRAGLEAFERREPYTEERLRALRAPGLQLPADLAMELKRHRRAWANFEALAPGHRKRYVAWLLAARKPETRARRMTEAIDRLERNETLGMK